jgi:hypothetical protein
MFNPKELEKLLNFDMPHRNRSNQPGVNSTPDFTSKCHYTLRIYTCTHKSFSQSPRITHISPCLYGVSSSTTASPILSQISPYEQLNASKKRCNNMASKPREIQINELCSKCRPHNLGAEKKLRDFERLVPDRGDNGEVRGNEVLNSTTTEDWGGSFDEIERGLKALTLTETPAMPESEPALTSQNVSQIPAKEQILEQPSDSQVSDDTLGKKERWAVAGPSAPNGEAPLAVRVGKKGLLSTILWPFGNSEEASTPESITGGNIAEGDKVGKESAENGGKTSGKGKWVKVRDDLDWEVVSDEERKEKKLWRDEAEWVNIGQ